MMTRSVMTQAANLTTNTTVSTTSKGKQSGTGFDQLINSSLQSVQNVKSDFEIPAAKNNVAAKSDKKVADSNEVTDLADQANKVQDNTITESDTPTEKVQVSKSDAASTADKTDIADEATEVDEELAAEITAMLQTLQQTVMEAMDLTTEEFDQLLMDQGMNLTDLLQPGNLQQFILASAGKTDITAVLTDENLAATMNDLLQAVEDLKTDTGLNLTAEEMKAILDQANNSKNQNADEIILPGTGKEGISESDDNQTQQTLTANSNSVKDEQKSTATQSTTTEESSNLTATTASDVEESTSDTNQNSSNDQKDMTAADAFQTFIDNLVKTSQETKVDFAGNMAQVTELRNIANQILESIKVSVTTENSSMELQLNPEHLGKVNLTVQSKNGIMTAQFVVQNELSKEAIESQLHTLRETLNSQGIKVEAIEVTVATYTSEQNTGDGTSNEAESKEEKSGKKITIEEALNMTDMPLDENTVQDITGSLGSQIDYTA